MPKFNWKQKKTIAMYLNRRQSSDSPANSLEEEIELEQGGFLVTEASTINSPNYIITE
jgi:uncharacterized SAM-dependent methyltransferase